MAGCSCRSGRQPPSMIVGCLHLQEKTPTPLGSPSSTKASRVLKFSGVTMEFSFDPGDTMTSQALLDPITDVPCPRRGHTCSPSGWLWGWWCWDASISSLLGSNRLHPLKCPSPFLVHHGDDEGCKGLEAATRTGQVQEHLPEGLLLAGRLPLTHPGTRTGALVQRELPSSNVVTYQQFTRDLYQERLYNADKYKYHNLGSSILMKDCSNLEWKSIYNQDYQHQMGVHGGFYTEEIRPSPVFPEESRFNYSRWVSEYADSYSIFLKRLDWSSPISAQWLPFGKDARWTPRWKESTH
ncbi:uncharacterized protein LOC121676694 isoform X1 [Corvus kubaryi]|uniref:uncharacterized protein LOC121676694 isoform X1 n=1 Tax=Corvus kubaryi TaxID=68294 RepID=UPI001C05AD3B|nr:uncharacterized protein LOC121676694 isoform X1 [Corvus kubaryi]